MHCRCVAHGRFVRFRWDSSSPHISIHRTLNITHYWNHPHCCTQIAATQSGGIPINKKPFKGCSWAVMPYYVWITKCTYCRNCFQIVKQKFDPSKDESQAIQPKKNNHAENMPDGNSARTAIVPYSSASAHRARTVLALTAHKPALLLLLLVLISTRHLQDMSFPLAHSACSLAARRVCVTGVYLFSLNLTGGSA